MANLYDHVFSMSGNYFKNNPFNFKYTNMLTLCQFIVINNVKQHEVQVFNFCNNNNI